MTDMPYSQHLAQPAFVVVCDGAVDQICGSKAEANREAKDLRKMGFDKVTVKSFATWAEAHAFEDKINAL
jgi:hypothetical protein